MPRYSAQSAIDMGMVGFARIEGVPIIRKLYIATLKHGRKPALIDQFIDAAKFFGRMSEQTAARQLV